MEVGYSELTPELKALICNGCGAKGGWIQPPNIMFLDSCNQHDYYYWRGGNEIDRYEADFQFYLMMLQAAHTAGWYPLRRIYAWLYFKGVRAFGHKAFFYGPKRGWETINDPELLSKSL